MKTETLTKTDNDRIFVSGMNLFLKQRLRKKLEVLQTVLQTEDDDAIRVAMKQVVPTYPFARRGQWQGDCESKFIEDTATGAAVPVAG